MNDHAVEVMKYIGDFSSVTLLIGYFVGALPIIATMLTIIWTVLRIYETETVQKWIRNRNGPNKAS